jgi:hypothetical protein
MSEANTNAQVEVKFKDDFIALEDKLKPLATGDAKTGIVSIPAGALLENAPEGVTEASYETHKKFFDLANNVLTKIGADVSVDLFKENKELQEVTMTVPIYKKDAYEGVFKRTGTSRNVRTGEVSTYVGSIGVGRINYVSSRTQTEWQAIKTNLRNMAEAAGL